MSLNWKVSEDLHKSFITQKTRYKGVEQPDGMHPVLHRLIFLTMTLKHAPERGLKEFNRRLKYASKVSPDLTDLNFGDGVEHVEIETERGWVPWTEVYTTARKRFDKDGKLDGYTVSIDENWTRIYDSLSTNADHATFAQWFKKFNDSTLSIIERGY